MGTAAPLPGLDDSPAPRAAELLDSHEAHAASDASDTPAQTASATSEEAPGPATTESADSPVETEGTDKTAQAVTTQPVAIASTDIAARARAHQAMSTQTWGNVQCYGSIIASQKLPSTGIQGTKLTDGRTLRFGTVDDSGSITGRAFEFALNLYDPYTARSDRCEIAFAATAQSGVPRNSVFWHAFAVKLPDWSGTSDEQAIAQWHAGDTSGGLLPVYTLLVRGTTMRLVLRYDTSTTPSRATTKALVVWSTTAAPINRWVTLVTQGLISTDRTKAPFVKTWLNGTQIVNYNGPVGYNQPTVQQYAKHGIYHWVDSTNTWNPAIPTRTLRLKDPVLIRDALRRYQPETVRAFVEKQ